MLEVLVTVGNDFDTFRELFRNNNEGKWLSGVDCGYRRNGVARMAELVHSSHSFRHLGINFVDSGCRDIEVIEWFIALSKRLLSIIADSYIVCTFKLHGTQNPFN